MTGIGWGPEDGTERGLRLWHVVTKRKDVCSFECEIMFMIKEHDKILGRSLLFEFTAPHDGKYGAA